MITALKKTDNSLSLAKTILFSIACIAIFIATAVICGMLTSWIKPNALKILIREVFLRLPLTLLALHFFSTRVIKVYKPAEIYGKLVFVKLLKWTALAFILPGAIGMFYYLFGIMLPFSHTVSLSFADKLGVFVKWAAVSVAAGITEEVLFRGHLFMIISSRCSKRQAIFITSLIFGLLHIAMLTAFTPVDIFIVVCGGIIAGTMFSFIYQYTKTIWYAAVVHIVWDIFFIGKITTLATTQADANHALMAFKLTTHNLLFTGGNFGMEASVPCLVVYIVTSAGLYLLIRNHKQRIKVA
jgi:membrane protease YdiL (CAAX protease family)